MQYSSVLPSRTLHFAKQYKLHYLLILALFLAVMPSLTYGQTATIVGTVTDPSGAVVPNVTLTVTNTATGRVITIPTNDAGQYVVPDIPIGKYDVKATAPGFKVAERKGIVLNVNDRDRVDFQMNIGATTETVTVEANALTVQSDSSEVSSLVNSTQITELATNGRTIYSYVALTPGASNLNPDSQLPVPTGGAASNISFNGNRSAHNLYLLDGGENSDRGGAGTSSVLPSIDAISETQTLSSNYSSEYGLSSGATISSAVKSGTSAFHASAWEFFRNDALQARNYFNPSPQPVGELRYNIFGFNAGGPVTFGHLYNPEKKKTFFFYNMEWRKFIYGGSPISQHVPDTSTYGGNLGSTAINVPSTTLVTPAILFRNCPGGVAPAGIVQGQPFPSNTIPTCMLDPNTQSLLTAGGKYGGIFPAPTTIVNGVPTFQEPVAVPTNVREEIVRVDHNFTDKISVFGHFLAEQIDNNQARTMWSGDNVPSIGNTFGNPSYAGVVHLTQTINPTLVNEVAFNYNGNRINILPVGLYTSPFNLNNYFNAGSTIIPSVNLGGSTGTNYTVNWMPWTNKADDYQIRDDISWTKGRHQLRMGGSWALYKKNQTWFKNTQGNYVFNGEYTGNDFADYLLGLAQNYTQDALKAIGNWPNDSWALYFQDNWRVNSRLTLNLGLRWDGIPHTYEENNNMANFYPEQYNPANAALLSANGNTVLPTSPGLFTNPSLNATFYTNGIGICGVSGNPRGCVDDAWQNWQPRLGFAYDLFGNGKTVIRGGYGIMNERIQGNDVYYNAGTVPTAASVNFNNVVFNNPAQNTGGVVNAGSIPVNNVTGLDKNDYAAPRSTQFSLGVQHSIGKSVLSVAYVGTQNRHQNYYQEIDLAPIGDIPGYVAGTPGLVPYNTVLPYPGYHGIRLAKNEANGDYNGLQIGLRGQLVGNDLTYQLGYTYSHTNDAGSNGSSAGDLGNATNPYAGWQYDLGPSNFDHHQIFFANFVYDLPFFKHSDSKAMKTMLGGWEVSGIVTAESGAPLNIGLSGNNASSIVPNAANRPDHSGTGHDPHTQAEWFDTSIFSMPACLTGPDCWGNTPRNFVWGPGRDNWNLSVFKNFNFSETRGSYLQFRAEFFNVWNHTQWIGDEVNGGISRNFGAGDFGHVTNAYDPRTIQLALKLYF